MNLWLLLGAALAVAGVVVVALPFLREPEPESGRARRARRRASGRCSTPRRSATGRWPRSRSSRPTTARAGSPTRTTAPSSAPCGATRPRRSAPSTAARAGGVSGRRREDRRWVAERPRSRRCLLALARSSRQGRRRRPRRRQGTRRRRIGELARQAPSSSGRRVSSPIELSAVAGRVRELQAGVDAQQARLDVLEGSSRRRASGSCALDGRSPTRPTRLERSAASTGSRSRGSSSGCATSTMTDGPDRSPSCSGRRRSPTCSTTSSSSAASAARTSTSRHGSRSRATASRTPRRQARAARAEAAPVDAAVDRRRRRAAWSRVERLVASRDALVAADSEKSATLGVDPGDRESTLAEIDELRAAERGARGADPRGQAALVRAGNVGPVGRAACSAGPSPGPVTSGFGMRWGRMHEGIDIGGPRRARPSRGRRGHGDLRGLDERLRQPRRRRPRGRPLDRVRAQLVLADSVGQSVRGRGRPIGNTGTRPARTSTSRCGSTARGRSARLPLGARHGAHRSKVSASGMAARVGTRVGPDRAPGGPCGAIGTKLARLPLDTKRCLTPIARLR